MNEHTLWLPSVERTVEIRDQSTGEKHRRRGWSIADGPEMFKRLNKGAFVRAGARARALGSPLGEGVG